MVVQLMKYGADPSLIDGEGCSCIHLAAQFGHTSIVAYLIAKGQVNFKWYHFKVVSTQNWNNKTIKNCIYQSESVKRSPD